MPSVPWYSITRLMVAIAQARGKGRGRAVGEILLVSNRRSDRAVGPLGSSWPSTRRKCVQRVSIIPASRTCDENESMVEYSNCAPAATAVGYDRVGISHRHVIRHSVAVVVPFREQLPLQCRKAQLDKFLPFMETFFASACGCWPLIVVVEQSQDGKKFNRGQLLNIGFRLAQEARPDISSFIMHDVDLLPSADLQTVYANPPPEGKAVHLASVWQKYSYSTFIGGVLAFRPTDFERTNGFPNNYWGWGLEDDQLALRMARCQISCLRVKRGCFTDLDPVNMKGFLDAGDPAVIKEHLPWYNAEMFRRRELTLDEDWTSNGLRSLRFRVLHRQVNRPVVQHVVVELDASGVG